MKLTSRSYWLFIKDHFFILIPVLFYFYTRCRWIGLGDPALLIDAIKRHSICTHANNHNLTILIGMLFQKLPFDDIAYKANIAAAFIGSITIILLYLILISIFKSRLTAAIASSFVMIARTQWWSSTISEDYGVNGIFTVIAIYLFYKLTKEKKPIYLYLAFFNAGLAIFNHVQMGVLFLGCTFTLTCLMVQERKLAIKNFLLSAGAFFLGFLPYFLTFLNDVRVVKNLQTVIDSATGKQFQGVMIKGNLLVNLWDTIFLTIYEYPSLYLIAILVGSYLFLRQWGFSKAGLGLLCAFFINTMFFASYNTWDKFCFLLPSFIIMGFFGAYAVDFTVKRLKAINSRLLNLAAVAALLLSLFSNFYIYNNVPTWGENPNSIFYSRFNNNYTFNIYHINKYIWNPNKRNFDEVDKFCDLLLEKLPPNSTFYDDDGRTSMVLTLYFQGLLKKRPDIDMRMIDSWGFLNWGDSGNKFFKELKKAYELDSDLFVNSLGSPYNRVLSEMPPGEKYTFKKYALDDKRWVYKLVTAKELGITNQFLYRKWDIIDLNAPSLIDLKIENALGTNAIMQNNMASFGANWLSNDQIFVTTDSSNNEISFLLRIKEKTRATMELGLTKAPDFTSVEIYLNNQKISERPIDLYSSVVQLEHFSFPHVSFESGNNILTIIPTGNKSAIKKFAIDTVKLSKES